jgi:hypothetical protein
MYTIDFAEHLWACSIESEYCWTPVLQAVCDRWEAAIDAWAVSYLRPDNTEATEVVHEDF